MKNKIILIVIILVLILQTGCKKTSTKNFSSFDDYNHAKIGLPTTGTILVNQVNEKLPDCTHVYLTNVIDDVLALKSNKIDAFPTDEPLALLIVKKNPELKIFKDSFAKDSYCCCLKKKSSLTSDINKFIKKCKKNNTLKQLKEKWVSGNEKDKNMPNIDWDTSKGTLKVMFDINCEPMCYLKDNKVSGYEPELIYKYAKEKKKDIKIIKGHYLSGAAALNSNKADIFVGSISYTEERKKKVDESEPYYDGAIVLVVKNQNEIANDDTSFVKQLKDSFINTFITESRYKIVLKGIENTLIISLLAGILGLILGFGICLIRRSKNKILCTIAKIFIRLIQGIPAVVLLMILYYIIFATVDISALFVGILGFSINFSSYVCEIFRVSIDSIDKGQIEAAYSLGYSKIKCFCKIVFPQAAKNAIPIIKGDYITMVKLTSVVGYITVEDLTKISDIIRSRTMEAFFPLISTAIIYFLIANILLISLTKLEQKVDPRLQRKKKNSVNLIIKNN